MRIESRILSDGETVDVACETCPVCEEYVERVILGSEITEIYLVGHDCGH